MGKLKFIALYRKAMNLNTIRINYKTNSKLLTIFSKRFQTSHNFTKNTFFVKITYAF
ncbi:hypothetical protein HMPREF9709_01790 [Helcococcus kunzii ATCC 51366]|uniref:Uncharacterized protein n=1 Tax=Helcococcus kunzii ATCC 51366 TaxID=883114 RepID=H3NR29_9FIRM|nr:hypothetical protein HMPREF9709_01790 [Helcococcus kunzii ATCC 51366]